MAEYRLEALLQLRARDEEQAQEAFARAVRQRQEEQRFLEELDKELERMVAERKRRRQDYADKLASGAMKVLEQAAATRYIDRLKELEAEQQGRIDGQREAVRDAEKVVKRAQDALLEATQAKKALDRHKEQWLEEIRRERQVREENLLDEIAQTIHQRRDREHD